MCTLVIFSGLPGTGKSTLANRLARELCWPPLRIDDVVNNIPENADTAFWDSQIEVLLTLTEAQLEVGVDVIVDSVFMNTDRNHAQELARKYQSRFRPIYTFMSDDEIWKERVTRRYEKLNNSAVATWEQLQYQSQHFLEWELNTALFVDGVQPAEQNYAEVLRFVTAEKVDLKPLEEIPLVKDKYH